MPVLKSCGLCQFNPSGGSCNAWDCKTVIGLMEGYKREIEKRDGIIAEMTKKLSEKQ